MYQIGDNLFRRFTTIVINDAVISAWKAKQIVIFYTASDQKNQWGKLFLQRLHVQRQQKASKQFKQKSFLLKYMQTVRPEVILRLWIKYGKHFVERPTEQDK